MRAPVVVIVVGRVPPPLVVGPWLAGPLAVGPCVAPPPEFPAGRAAGAAGLAAGAGLAGAGAGFLSVAALAMLPNPNIPAKISSAEPFLIILRRIGLLIESSFHFQFLVLCFVGGFGRIPGSLGPVCFWLMATLRA